MASTKNFFHDRTALLLVSAASFLTLLSIVLILLKINAARGTVNYIVGYRANLGLDRYITGTVVDMISFIFAALLIFGIGTLLGLPSVQNSPRAFTDRACPNVAATGVSHSSK